MEMYVWCPRRVLRDWVFMLRGKLEAMMSLAGTLLSNPAAARWDVVMFRVFDFGGKTRTSNFAIAINGECGQYDYCPCNAYQ
jgi:hypothetical protein